MDPDFIWTSEMIRAYDQLRNALLEAPILVAVDWNFPLFLSVDASIRGEGWVLWQLIKLSDGSNVAVAILYGSKKYNESERNWETTRQEASAIRSALEDVYDYVFGHHFYLFSDHLNLRFMHNSINRAVIRMRDFLTQFNMTVVHCPGIWNNADPISRLEPNSLPSELAQSLLAATEARLQGKFTLISIGTSTEEDRFTGGQDSIQPRNATSQKGEPSSGLTTKALSTRACPNTGPICLLCSLNEPWDYPSSEDEGPTGETSSALKTNATIGGCKDEIDWVKVSKMESQLEPAYLYQEAKRWNEKHEEDPSASLFNRITTDHHISDSGDVDDVRWCTDLNRKSVVLKTASTARFRQHQSYQNPVTGTFGQNETLTEVDSNSGTPTLKVIIPEDQEKACEPYTKPNSSLQHPREIVDHSTQTSPADFRIANTTFPMREDFQAIHNNESGHHGVDYSYRKLLKHCGSKWANERGEATKVKASLKEFIDACPICQKVRGLKEKIKTKHSFIVSRPFLELSIDFIVFTRTDRNGNRYLIVAIDNFMKLVELKPTPHRDAETVAKFLLELQSRYGPSARLRSDKDGAFTGLLIRRLNDARGTETAPCIPYHPQANSICERQNAIIMNHLNALILGCALGPDSKVGWSDLVPKVFSLVNNTPKNPLGISPLSMVYGVFANYDQPLLPESSANTIGMNTNPVDYVETLMAWQNKLIEISEDIQSEHFDKLQSKFNKNKEARAFHVGDFVLQDKRAAGVSGKPSAKWIGPFLVLERRNNDPSHPVLDLMNLTDMKVKEASIDDCRKFNTSWFNEDNLHREVVRLSATDDNEYVVERIISHQPPGETRTKPVSKYLFEVKWQDFEETTWEPYAGLKDLEPMELYSKLHPGLKLTP
jgi:hypothetical protein